MTLGKSEHTSEPKWYFKNLMEYFDRGDEYADKKNQFILRIPKETQSCSLEQNRVWWMAWRTGNRRQLFILSERKRYSNKARGSGQNKVYQL